MARSRRFIPSISQLSAFEAVLRTGSTAGASRDMDLSQGAISRLVQNLETQLGQRLFLRERQRLVPTVAAKAYGRDVTRALDLIARASMELSANPDGGVLSLAVLPAFSTHWLAPRMAGFLSAHPDVTVNLATRMKKFNFAAESFDAAVHFGEADWRGAGHLPLFPEVLVPCAAPSLLARHSLSGPSDVLSLPLLQIETRPGAWADWLGALGVAGPLPGGMLFDQFAAMAQAAVHGLGAALLPEFHVADELASGRLTELPGGRLTGPGQYFLVWPEARADYPPLAAFRDWIAAEVSGPQAFAAGPD